jgi:DNA-binding SARP family transcriptional activator
MVGPFAVRQAGKVLRPTEVGSRKARTLLAVLGIEAYKVVSLWTIAETLWPDGQPRTPQENVATLVSRLRATLGTDVILGGRTAYRLGPAVEVDLYEGGQLVAAAEAALLAREPREARAAAESAVDLLDGGPVLADYLDEAWTEAVHDRHLDLLRRARHTVAAAALRAGDVDAAVSAAEAAVRSEPLDEVAYRQLLAAHDRAGEPARALAAYQRLRTTLARELGVDPAPATRQLYLAILQANAAADST